MSTASFDVVVFGATSFVGQILVEYLRDYQGESFTWAMAGRSASKLAQVQQDKGVEHIPVIVADSHDEQALTAMCAQAKVIISTVGPYALYGEPLVKVCAETGTDYCDLTGEPQWIKKMLDKYETLAQQQGARIVHTAGFDSIPSDLGVWTLQQQALAATGQPIEHIRMRVRKIIGAASGGTVASMLNVLEEASREPSLRKLLVNPYVLCPSDHPYTLRQTNHKKAHFEQATNMWIMPFVMAAINERIVHRSNALLGHHYGENFRYDEAMQAKSAGQAWGMTLGLGAFMVGASISPIRKLMAKTFLPKPGEGPSPEAQRKGMFDMRFYGTDSEGTQHVVKVTGDRDPGYGSTAKMLAQVGLCLAFDVPELAGGSWTPAAGLAKPLTKRLAQHAGVEISRL
jgi:short subunit dehydrogenase-like uncharacterized protein